MEKTFLQGYKTIIVGVIGATLISVAGYFNIPTTQLIASIGAFIGILAACLRDGMKTETERKIIAYGEQLSEAVNIVLNRGNLPVADTTITPAVEQVNEPVLPTTIDVKMSDGTTKTISVDQLTTDAIEQLKKV